MPSPPSVPIAHARRIALAAQGFSRARPATVGRHRLMSSFARMGTVQIDTISVFARSHYLPFFSRLGAYDPTVLDALTFAPRGPYTEYWAHAATFIPVEDWALWRFRMDDAHVGRAGGPDSWFAHNTDVVEWVRSELAARGPLRPADIEHDSRTARRGPWWDWDAVKHSLEILLIRGEVAIAGRAGFEKRYALAEHVIPAEVLSRPVPRADAVRELTRRAVRAYGIATASDVADYYRIRRRGEIMQALRDLTDAGEIEPVVVDGWTRAGRPLPAWRHAQATLPRRIAATAVLTPFDPVVWFRDRAHRLFDFDYRIEIYTPAARRRFGYYSLPVLLDDRIVARVDLKADRAARTLLVQSAWWEDGSRTADGAARIVAELERAAAWQGLEELSIGARGDAVDDLARVLPRARRH